MVRKTKRAILYENAIGEAMQTLNVSDSSTSGTIDQVETYRQRTCYKQLRGSAAAQLTGGRRVLSDDLTSCQGWVHALAHVLGD